MERNDRNAEGAEGDGSCIGEQPKARGLKRGEAESDEDGCADGHGSAEACCALEKCAEGEGDQEKLQTAVGSDACQTVLQLSESAGSHGELIQEQDREDDPTDREESVGGTVAGREKRETHRHVKDHESDCERGSKAGEGGDMPFDAEASHGYKKHEQR